MSTILSSSTAAAIVLATFLPGLAAAATLTFDGDVCGPVACSNGSPIDQGTGDLTGLDVVYDSDVSTIAVTPMSFWLDSYSDLSRVAYGVGSTAGISFVPTAGGTALVTGFSLGAWPSTDRMSQWSIIDLFDGTILAQSGAITVDGLVSTRVTGSWSSASGIQLQFGPDAFNVGIDNIDYALLADDGQIPVIPLPAGLPLLAGGLGALALLRRSRRD